MASSPDKRSTYSRQLSPSEEKRVIKVGFVLSSAALLFMAGFALLVHMEYVRLYPSSMNVDLVKGYAGRVEFALRYQTLLVFWLLFTVVLTIYGRLTTKALNPLDNRTEERVQLFKNVLTNSFESVVISVFSQLIFVSFAPPSCILKVIPLVNIIQFIGRVAFLAGYPLFRGFGFMNTLVPNALLNIYNLYRFGQFLFV